MNFTECKQPVKGTRSDQLLGARMGERIAKGPVRVAHGAQIAMV